MPCLNIPLEAIGPVLEVGIAPPQSALPAGAPPSPVEWIKGLADTGCTHTSLHSSVATKAGLRVIGKTEIINTTGTVDVNVYHGDLVLRPMIGGKPFEWRFFDCRFLELIHKNASFDALLGMETLTQGMFTIQGQLGFATFCW